MYSSQEIKASTPSYSPYPIILSYRPILPVLSYSRPILSSYFQLTHWPTHEINHRHVILQFHLVALHVSPSTNGPCHGHPTRPILLLSYPIILSYWSYGSNEAVATCLLAWVDRIYAFYRPVNRVDSKGLAESR